MKYNLVSAKSVSELEARVNEMISQGWALYGQTVAVNANPNRANDIQYLQPMTFIIADNKNND